MHRLNIWNKTPGGRKPRLYPHRYFFLTSSGCFRFSFIIIIIIIITWRPVYTHREREISLSVFVYMLPAYGAEMKLYYSVPVDW
jgi:hypothetical protein